MDAGPRTLSIVVTGGLMALAAALAAASLLGLMLRRRAGRFRAGQARPTPDVLTAADDAAGGNSGLRSDSVRSDSAGEPA
jgi:hypothetical protein